MALLTAMATWSATCDSISASCSLKTDFNPAGYRHRSNSLAAMYERNPACRLHAQRSQMAY